MKTSLFYLPSLGSRRDIEAGMAGQRGDLYQQMLAELGEQARLADELGYDSISFTEHHFHIEGCRSATACPPLSCTTPFGMPVVPDV